MSAALWLLVASALEVEAPAGCLDVTEVAVAIDEIGGIDVAESVAVHITPVMDTYSLVVDIALIDAPPVHREVPLRPRECADVADLVAVLVQGQRRAALEARLRPPAPTAAPPVKPALPAGDPRTRAPTEVQASPGACDSVRFACLDAGASSEEKPLFANACDGPVACGGMRTGLSFGGALPFAARIAADIGYDVTPEVTAVLVGEALDRDGTRRGAASLGLAYRTKIDVLELSARGLVGAGVGSSVFAKGEDPEVVCDPSDPSGASVKTVSTTPNAFYAQPTLAVRARIGYVFAEAGGFWSLGLDEYPAAYLAIGFSLFGP